MRTRRALLIEPSDQTRIVAALERWPEKEGLVGWRTRAFVYLLWDGALRTGTAIWLNIDEVVGDFTATRVQVVQKAVLRRCEANQYRERAFLMSDRVREAISDYLKVARRDGWLAKRGALQGPLWIATQPVGAQKRMSQRTAMQAWRSFIETVNGLSREDYQLDDVVLTGRIQFLKAARGSTDLMSDHAGISRKWAGHYSDHLRTESNVRDVITQLNKQQKRKAQ